ncbi:MAG: tRNA 2-thiouridine synthesizing protein C [Glaciecola sp.]|jgi:tRNA 2-thiouridine synthesizing protein C
MTKLLIISTQPPYVCSASQDALEAALAASNVGVEVIFVFSQQGLYQLLESQNSTYLQKRSIVKQIKALPLYDIEEIYYVKDDITELMLSSYALTSTAKPIDIDVLQQLCAASNAILRF